MAGGGLLTVRFGRNFAICDQRLPKLLWASSMIRASSVVKGASLILAQCSRVRGAACHVAWCRFSQFPIIFSGADINGIIGVDTLNNLSDIN